MRRLKMTLITLWKMPGQLLHGIKWRLWGRRRAIKRLTDLTVARGETHMIPKALTKEIAVEDAHSNHGYPTDPRGMN